MKLKLNKSKWASTSIENVADEVKDKLKALEGYEDSKFIRPEDLLVGDLFVKSFRSIEGIKSGKKCQRGDILFARRSVSIAQFKKRSCILEWDGICSDELTVIREKKNVIQKGFLNLILNTNKLWDFGISHSGGSVSKRIKWQDLKKYQFDLPEIDDQKKLLSLFLNIEDQINISSKQEKHYRDIAKKITDKFIDENRFGDLLVDNNCVEYKFCDCVNKLLRRTNPVEDGIERIVAGENLESQDFKIRTWGTVGKDFLGPAFHVMFEPGDILFGSRRTYLRKVSFADFKGVCANTTFVIKSKEDILLQDLLKHIMLSERFIQYSIAKSKGSTNPYINWKDLNDFKFKLPDLDTQRKMADILDDCIANAEIAREQSITLKKLKHKLLDEIFD